MTPGGTPPWRRLLPLLLLVLAPLSVSASPPPANPRFGELVDLGTRAGVEFYYMLRVDYGRKAVEWDLCNATSHRVRVSGVFVFGLSNGGQVQRSFSSEMKPGEHDHGGPFEGNIDLWYGPDSCPITSVSVTNIKIVDPDAEEAAREAERLRLERERLQREQEQKRQQEQARQQAEEQARRDQAQRDYEARCQQAQAAAQARYQQQVEEAQRQQEQARRDAEERQRQIVARAQARVQTLQAWQDAINRVFDYINQRSQISADEREQMRDLDNMDLAGDLADDNEVASLARQVYDAMREQIESSAEAARDELDAANAATTAEQQEAQIAANPLLAQTYALMGNPRADEQKYRSSADSNRRKADSAQREADRLLDRLGDAKQRAVERELQAAQAAAEAERQRQLQADQEQARRQMEADVAAQAERDRQALAAQAERDRQALAAQAERDRIALETAYPELKAQREERERRQAEAAAQAERFRKEAEAEAERQRLEAERKAEEERKAAEEARLAAERKAANEKRAAAVRERVTPSYRRCIDRERGFELPADATDAMKQCDASARAGAAALERGDYPAAAKAFARCRELSPDDDRHEPSRALALILDSNLDEAATVLAGLRGTRDRETAALARALRLPLEVAGVTGPGVSEAERQATDGLSLAAGGFLEPQTLDALRAAVAAEPCEPRWQAILGATLLQFKPPDWQAAATAYQAAAELTGDDAALWDKAGACALQAGKYDDAVRAYARAVQLNMGDAAARDAMGTALWYAGRLPEAIDSYVQATGLEPGNARYAAHLKLARGAQSTPAAAGK